MFPYDNVKLPDSFCKENFSVSTDRKDNDTIGDRLRQERERLGLNQTDFGAAGGVSRISQANYEGGKHTPDAGYLTGLVKIGADLYYIVTGARSEMPRELSSKEAALVEHYRQSTPERRKSLEEMAAALAKLSREEEGGANE